MMNTITAAVTSFSLAAAAFGAAYAQDAVMKPADGKMMMSGGMMSKKMSDKDMATLKMCKAMSHDAMMKDQRCMDLRKSHPDAMTMDSGGMMKK